MLVIKNYFPTNGKSSPVVALINFYIPEWGLHLNGCKYIRKKNGGFFVAYPSKKIEKESQDTQYFPYYSFEKEKNDRFQSSAQKAINEYINKKREGNFDELGQDT